MKTITYKQFLKAIKKADAVIVDGNVTFHAVQDDGRVDFYWDDSDGLDYRYYAEDNVVFDPNISKDVHELTIEVARDGSLKLNGLYNDSDDEFSFGTTTIQLLMITPYEKVTK